MAPAPSMRVVFRVPVRLPKLSEAFAMNVVYQPELRTETVSASEPPAPSATPPPICPATPPPEIAAALNGCLADAFALYMKTKNFH